MLIFKFYFKSKLTKKLSFFAVSKFINFRKMFYIFLTPKKFIEFFEDFDKFLNIEETMFPKLKIEDF